MIWITEKKLTTLFLDLAATQLDLVSAMKADYTKEFDGTVVIVWKYNKDSEGKNLNFWWLDLAVAKRTFINEMKVDYTKKFDGTRPF